MIKLFGKIDATYYEVSCIAESYQMANRWCRWAEMWSAEGNIGHRGRTEQRKVVDA